MYSAILFDLDGTLADSVTGIEWSAHEALGEVLPTVPQNPLREFIGPTMDVIFRNYLQAHAPQVLSQMDEQQWRDLIAAYRRVYDGDGCLRSLAFPDATAVLQSLRADDVRCFVVTNKPRLATKKVIRALELDHCFEALVSPDSREPKYQDKAEMVREVLSDFELSASEVLLIGDGRDDAHAAHENGIDFAAICYGYGNVHLHHEFPVRFYIEELSQLLPLIAKCEVLSP